MARFRIGLTVVVASVAVFAWALPAGAQTSATSAKKAKTTAVTVTAAKPSEFSFTLSKKSAPVGTVVFTVTNKGVSPHDFKINGKQTKLLSSKASQKLTVKFTKAGSYPYLCTVPGHAAAGMKGVFKVTK